LRNPPEEENDMDKRVRNPKMKVYRSVGNNSPEPQVKTNTLSLIDRAENLVYSIPVHLIAQQRRDYSEDYYRSICEQLGLD
jgi:hypothetical protein